MTRDAAVRSLKEGINMPWSYGPPMEPPEPRMVNCHECEGDGFIMFEVDGEQEDVTCLRCDGTGETGYDPDDNPYAPDNWKEAEGLA